jgi:aldehyde:ferredoxin oxidoreductase
MPRFRPQDDVLPEKFFKPLAGDGPTAGVAIDPAEFESALDLYYQLMHWTPEGVPTKAALVDLGIEWVGECLES